MHCEEKEEEEKFKTKVSLQVQAKAAWMDKVVGFYFGVFFLSFILLCLYHGQDKTLTFCALSEVNQEKGCSHIQ